MNPVEGTMMTEPGTRSWLDEIDVALLDRLCGDRAVLDMGQVRRVLDVDRHDLRHMWHATCNYLTGATTQWPPPRKQARAAKPTVEDVQRAPWWWDHAFVLPVPDFYDPGVDRPRWFAGTIAEWALRVLRMDLAGHVHAARKPGRGRERKPPVPWVTSETVNVERLDELLDDDTFWDREAVRRYFGVSAKSLWKWENGGSTFALVPFPEPARVQVGGRTRTGWRAGDVAQWGLWVRKIGLNGEVVVGRKPGAEPPVQ